MYGKRRFRVRFALVRRQTNGRAVKGAGMEWGKKKNEKTPLFYKYVVARSCYNKTRALVSGRSSAGTRSARMIVCEFTVAKLADRVRAAYGF